MDTQKTNMISNVKIAIIKAKLLKLQKIQKSKCKKCGGVDR